MRHPDAPLCARRRLYSVMRCPTAVPGQSNWQVQYRTWILRRWKGCSPIFTNDAGAYQHLAAIKRGLPEWTPVVSGRLLQ